MFKKKSKYLSKMSKKIEKEENQWAIEKPLLEREAVLRNEKENFIKKKKRKKTSTSKLLILFLFINCTIIEIFTGWTMIKMLSIALITGLSIDFSPLVALIGAVVGEVIGYGIYSIKAAKENTKNGIVYDSVLKENEENKEDIKG